MVQLKLHYSVARTNASAIDSGHEKATCQKEIEAEGFVVNEEQSDLARELERVLPEKVRDSPWRVPDSHFALDSEGRIDLGRLP